MASKVGEFKGNKTLILIDEKFADSDKFPFSFGVKKAKLILENIEAIKKFVEENG